MTDPAPPAAPLPGDEPRAGDVVRLDALAGAVAAGCALGAGELAAGLLGAASPLVAVGAAVIDLAPPGAKEVVVALFGEANKLALTVLVAVVVLALGAGIGRLGRRRPGLANAAIGALTGVGLLAALRPPDAVPTLAAAGWAVQAATGIAVLGRLLAAVPLPGVVPPPRGADAAALLPATVPAAAVARRSFLLSAGALAAVGGLAGWFGRRLLDDRAAAAAGTTAGSLPPVLDRVPSPGPDAAFDVAGLTPLVVPNADFYRIDTALVVPAVDLASWRLRIHGLVEREVELDWAALTALPFVERYVTIACVSNEVGGDLVGNAAWTGIPLRAVLDLAGVRPGATQLVPRSVDGWTAGFPTSWLDGPGADALVAIGMNGVPLPPEHGWPARLIVPGLFGYVSATKWLSELELTTMEAFDAYWIPRGWAKEAPVLTQSRIDVPRPDTALPAGPTAIAGVAWAPTRGVARVEVRVDDGPWRAAALAAPLSEATWVQWRLAWDATPGDHVIRVRATDGSGETQTAEATRPDPDGARGHHAIRVTVG